MTKRALITGILGQDGSYLAEFLLKKNMTVLGTTAPGEQPRSPHWLDCDVMPELVEADLADINALREVVAGFDPDEVYHLAAQSSVAASFTDPLDTFDITGAGALRLLEAVRLEAPTARVMLACSAEMFGQAEQSPQDENTPIRPVNPYAAAKAAAFHLGGVYREAMGVAVSCAILYNHESPRRGDGFVTKKIARGAAAIARGQASELLLGNLQAQRDWGAAQDYVRAMWLMLQQRKGDDYIIATGKARSVSDFCEAAFSHVGLNWQDHVHVSVEFFRPIDPALMCGNPAKAREVLGWQPEISFEQMVAAIVDTELAALDASPQK